MIKQSNDGTVFASIYVDDNFCVGHKAALKSFVEDLKQQGLTVKVLDKLTDYLSCSINSLMIRSEPGLGNHI